MPLLEVKIPPDGRIHQLRRSRQVARQRRRHRQEGPTAFRARDRQDHLRRHRRSPPAKSPSRSPPAPTVKIGQVRGHDRRPTPPAGAAAPAGSSGPPAAAGHQRSRTPRRLSVASPSRDRHRSRRSRRHRQSRPRHQGRHARRWREARRRSCRSLSAGPGRPCGCSQTCGRPPARARPAKKMSPLRQKIAQRLVAAQHEAAMLTTFNEVDMSAVMALRSKYQDDFVKKNGFKLGFMSFFAKAVVNALKEVPGINAQIDGNEIVENHYYDVGVAVSTEKGLMVPVIARLRHPQHGRASRRPSATSPSAPATARSPSPTSKAASSRSPTAASFGSMLSTPDHRRAAERNPRPPRASTTAPSRSTARSSSAR